jgi:hypothetical protein
MQERPSDTDNRGLSQWQANGLGDPFKPGRNGIIGLAHRIEMHSPLLLLILMPGTNDLQFSHVYSNAWSAAQSIALVMTIRQAPVDAGMPMPQILIVCPPPIRALRGMIAAKFAGAEQRCDGLAAAYRSVSAELCCHFSTARA